MTTCCYVTCRDFHRDSDVRLPDSTTVLVPAVTGYLPFATGGGYRLRISFLDYLVHHCYHVYLFLPLLFYDSGPIRSLYILGISTGLVTGTGGSTTPGYFYHLLPHLRLPTAFCSAQFYLVYRSSTCHTFPATPPADACYLI